MILLVDVRRGGFPGNMTLRPVRNAGGRSLEEVIRVERIGGST